MKKEKIENAVLDLQSQTEILKNKIKEDRIQRETMFGEEIEQLKKKYNCEIHPVITIKPGGLIPTLEIIAL